MRRAALARWFNLSIIAAVIAVLTVVLVSAPTPRIARAADTCGQDGSGDIEIDPNMSLAWDMFRPSEGPPGTWTGVSVSWTQDAPSSGELVVVWNPSDESESRVIGDTEIVPFEGSLDLDFNIPPDVPAGTYDLTVCWTDDNGVTWHELDVDDYLEFTVLEPSTCYGTSPYQFGTLYLEPSSGPSPSTFMATGLSGEGDFPASVVQLIWDWQHLGEAESPDGTVIAQAVIPVDNGGIVTFDNVDVPAPPLGSVGPHHLAICYFSGTEWYYADSYEIDIESYPTIFTVTTTEVCPDTEGNPNPPPLPFLTPSSGFAGDSFAISTSGGEVGVSVPDATQIQVVWDWGGPNEMLLYNQLHPDPGFHVDLDLNVPDVAPGDYSVTLCYMIDLGGGSVAWHQASVPDPDFPDNYMSPLYTVLDQEPEIPALATCSENSPSTAHSLFYETGDQTLHAGPPGTQDAAVLNALGSEPSLDTWVYSLVWDFGSPDPFTLGSFFADGEATHTFFFTVPYDATPGLHTIAVCYLYDNDGSWEWRPAGSTIQFNVQNLAPCGTVANIGNTNDPIGLTPNQGQIGSTFLASISGVEIDLEDALLVQVIWDWVEGNGDNIPPGGQVIAQITKSDTTNQATVTAMVPAQAQVGPHDVNICYYVPFDVGGFSVGPAESILGEWIAGDPNVFNVVEPGTSTPTPTPLPPTATSIPPTATSIPPTATQPPGVDPPAPTATPTFPPNVPVVGATPTPTSIIGDSARAAGTATALAGAPTPPPGGTGGGDGGTGGGGTGGTGGTGTGGGGTILNPNTGAQETTTPGAGTPGPTTTPAAAATGGPTTPTPTPTPSQTTPPSSEIQGSRTEFVQSVKGFSDVTNDFDVLLTNVLLTGLFLILIFLTAEIFNQTLRDNQEDIEGWMHNFFGPVLGIWAGLSHLMGVATLGSQKLKDVAWIGIVLVITVLIEGFLDPGFGFNKESLLLFISLLVAVGFVTYLTEGGEALVARTFFGQDTAVRVFPAAIGIALICVIMSRLGEFVPGILYGFVGTAYFLRPNTMNADQDGKTVFFPMAMMLAISVGAWLLVDQFRGPDPSDFDVVVEGILIGVFLATIESVAINMVPISYMDGRKLVDWNPIVWFLTAGVAVFLLWTVLLNDEREYFNSLQETTSQVAIIAILSCFGLSLVTWAWFRYRPGGHA